MSLTLRNVKGSPLTYTEMDSNLTYLEGLVTAGPTGPTGAQGPTGATGAPGATAPTPDLATVLIEGNETDGNDIKLSDGDKIFNDDGADLISVLELDPVGNINGTRLYTEDTDSGAQSTIGLGVQAGEGINLQSASGDYFASLELIPVGGRGPGLISLGYSDNDTGNQGNLLINNNELLINYGDNNTNSFIEVNPTSLSASSDLINLASVFNSTRGTNAQIVVSTPTNTTGIVDLYVGSTAFPKISGIEITENNIEIDALNVFLPTIPEYADNAAAVADGHPIDAIYKTSTGELRIVV